MLTTTNPDQDDNLGAIKFIQDIWADVFKHNHQSGGNANLPNSSYREVATSDAVIPPFVPTGISEWPNAVNELLKGVRAHSQIGYFHSMSRAWAVIDNQFIMWNPHTGSDLCGFGEISQVIVCVGEPVSPTSGVFRDSISKVLCLASSDVVALVGIEIYSENGVRRTALVNLDFYVAAPCILTKIVANSSTGDIVASGVDGIMYIVEYCKVSSLWSHRMRLLAAAPAFPMSRTIISIYRSVKCSWGYSESPIVDLICDSIKRCYYTLSSSNQISVYEKSSNCSSLQCISSISHNLVASNVCFPECSLVSLFLIDCDVFVAVSERGERYFYTLDRWGPRRQLKLINGVPSPIPNSCVTRSWCAPGLFVCSHSKPNSYGSDGTGDVILVSDASRLGSHNLIVPYADIVGVECISEVNPAAGNALSPIAISSVRQVMLIHRRGIQYFAFYRPVDTLHAILLEPAGPNRDRLLANFCQKYTGVDYCNLLIQISCAPVNPVTSPGWASASNAGGFRHNRVSSILNGPSPGVRRQAILILQSLSSPSMAEAERFQASSNREVIVTLSHCSLGLIQYLGQLVAPIWGNGLFIQNNNGEYHVIDAEIFHLTERSVNDFLKFLEVAKEDGLWHTSVSHRLKNSVRWDRNNRCATISMALTDLFTRRDSDAVQNAAVSSIFLLADATQQLLAFLSTASRLPQKMQSSSVIAAGVRDSKFSDFIINNSSARAFTRAITTMVFQQPSLSDELVLLREEMERRSPFLFKGSDRSEFDTIAQFVQLKEGASTSAIQNAVARLFEVAGSMWVNRTLLHIVQQLIDLGHTQDAVHVLVVAASQVDHRHPSAGYEALLEEITDMLQSMFIKERAAFDIVVGTPYSCGSMWYAAPADTETHRALFRWLAKPRAEESLNKVLRAILVNIQSDELEPFLASHIHELGLEYGRYLRVRKMDYQAAVEVCVRLVQDPLTHINPKDRLAFRVDCAREAREISLQDTSCQSSSLEQLLQTLLVQVHLMEVISQFLESGLSCLDDVVFDESNNQRTQREVAQLHLHVVESERMSQAQIFKVSLCYESFGGISVAMQTLALNRTHSPDIFVQLLERAVCAAGDAEFVTLNLLKDYGDTVQFPLTYFIMLVEGHFYRLFPTGSSKVPQLLTEAGVDVERAFDSYLEILERRNKTLTPCTLFDEAKVSDSYLVYSVSCLISTARTQRKSRLMEILAEVSQRVECESA